MTPVPFRRNPVITAAVDAVVALLAERPRGSLVCWDEMADAADATSDEPDVWRTHHAAILFRTRRAMRDGYGVWCRAVGKAPGGWTLLTVEDTLQYHTKDQYARAARRYDQTVKTLEAIPDRDLYGRTRELRMVQTDIAKRHRSQARTALRDSEKLFEASTITTPRKRPS